MSSALVATSLVALLSISLVRGSLGSGCDNGKLLLERDLHGDAAWACPAPPGSESTQSSPAVDTVYDSEPARQVCMREPISYNRPIPNSGPYRPVAAESGEYLYCPPQRWLSNLHRGATVLLYHPCAPLAERVRLSVLAHSCLSNYIVTPHPDLEPTRVALVSWGRTLELSGALSSRVCDWLESVAGAGTATGTNRDDVVGGNMKYSLLLIRPAWQHAQTQRSVRRCCEQSLFTPLDQGEEVRRQGVGGGGGGVGRRRGRQRREEKQEKMETMTTHESSPSTSGQASSRTESKPSPGPVRPGPEHPDPALLGSVPVIATATGPRGSGPGTETRPAKGGKSTDTDSGSAGQNSAEPKAPTDPQGGRAKNRVDVKQRQLSHEHTHNGETPALPPHPDPPDPGEGAAPTPAPGKARTPRTDEAMWAAGALGFLLALLALSVLHTRLYRQWRTTPSMYWHDPRRDYDSVADVIRRRLRIAERRHKRRSSQPRRQECALLPSSEEEESEDLDGDQ